MVGLFYYWPYAKCRWSIEVSWLSPLKEVLNVHLVTNKIWRFLLQVSIDQCCLARWLIDFVLSEKGSTYLVMDRTFWYWSYCPVHVLIIGLAWSEVAIPLCWPLLWQGKILLGLCQIALSRFHFDHPIGIYFARHKLDS